MRNTQHIIYAFILASLGLLPFYLKNLSFPGDEYPVFVFLFKAFGVFLIIFAVIIALGCIFFFITEIFKMPGQAKRKKRVILLAETLLKNANNVSLLFWDPDKSFFLFSAITVKNERKILQHYWFVLDDNELKSVSNIVRLSASFRIKSVTLRGKCQSLAKWTHTLFKESEIPWFTPIVLWITVFFIKYTQFSDEEKVKTVAQNVFIKTPSIEYKRVAPDYMVSKINVSVVSEQGAGQRYELKMAGQKKFLLENIRKLRQYLWIWQRVRPLNDKCGNISVRQQYALEYV